MTKKIQHIIAEKHRYFNDYNMTQSAESFVSFKKYRNLVNRKLKEAQNQFSEDFFTKIETSKEKWKFIKKKIGEKNKSPTITEIDENCRKTKDKKSAKKFSAKWTSTDCSIERRKKRAKISRV